MVHRGHSMDVILLAGRRRSSSENMLVWREPTFVYRSKESKVSFCKKKKKQFFFTNPHFSNQSFVLLSLLHFQSLRYTNILRYLIGSAFYCAEARDKCL